MNRRALAALLVLGLAGCNPKQTMAVGGVTIGAGLLITALPDDCRDCLGQNNELGAFVAFLGLVVLGVGAIGLASEQPKPIVVPANTFPSVPVTVDPEPALAPPSSVPASPLPPLPALQLEYTPPTDRQYAIQASSAAGRGDCRAAVQSGKLLTVDSRHKLAAVDPAFARCVETQP